MVVSVIPGPERLGLPAGCRTVAVPPPAGWPPPLPAMLEVPAPVPAGPPIAVPAAVACAPLSVPVGTAAELLAGASPPFAPATSPPAPSEPGVVATVLPQADSSDAA